MLYEHVTNAGVLVRSRVRSSGDRDPPHPPPSHLQEEEADQTTAERDAT